MNFPHVEVQVGCCGEDCVTYLTRGFPFVDAQMILERFFVGERFEANITGKLKFALPGRAPGAS